MTTVTLRARSATVGTNATGFAEVVGGGDALADGSDSTFVNLGQNYSMGSTAQDFITVVFDHLDPAIIDSITARRFFMRVSGQTTDLFAGQGDFIIGDGAPGGGTPLDAFMTDPDFMNIAAPTTIGYPDAVDPVTGGFTADDTWFIQAPDVIDPTIPATGSGESRWTVYEMWVEFDYTATPPFISPDDLVRVAPPMRIYPRDDGLGTSSHRRLWPPPSSIQASNRPAGYL